MNFFIFDNSRFLVNIQNHLSNPLAFLCKQCNTQQGNTKEIQGNESEDKGYDALLTKNRELSKMRKFRGIQSLIRSYCRSSPILVVIGAIWTSIAPCTHVSSQNLGLDTLTLGRQAPKCKMLPNALKRWFLTEKIPTDFLQFIWQKNIE